MNIALNILLIPLLGIIGAAIATASSTILMNILFLGESWRYEKIQPFSTDMLKTVLAGLLSLGIVYLIFEQIFTATPYWALIPAGILFFATYTLIFGKIGGLTEYDREIIITTGRKIGFEKETKKILEKIS